MADSVPAVSGADGPNLTIIRNRAHQFLLCPMKPSDCGAMIK